MWGSFFPALGRHTEDQINRIGLGGLDRVDIAREASASTFSGACLSFESNICFVCGGRLHESDTDTSRIGSFLGTMGQASFPVCTYHRFPRLHQQLVRKGIPHSIAQAILRPSFRQETDLGRVDWLS